MSRHYGAPANSEQEGDRHDQLPRWIKWSPKFHRMQPTDAKLYMYLIGQQNRYTRLVPEMRPTKLEEILGINRNRIAQGFKNLALDGFIAVAPRRMREVFNVQILFADPDSPRQLEGKNKALPLSAEVKKCLFPSEGRNKSLHRMPGQIAIDARNNCITPMPGADWPHEWEQVQEPFPPDGYTPGLDHELFGEAPQ